MLQKIKNWLRSRKLTKTQQEYIERAKRHGRGPSPVVEDQNRLCLTKKCGNEAISCYDQTSDDSTVWLEERTVIHCCADGSQFSYKARMGVAGIYCAMLGHRVEVKVYEASVVADSIVMDGVVFDFKQKSLSSVVYTDYRTCKSWVTTYRRPLFGVRAVTLGWEEFTTLLEKEMDQREPLRDFHVETAPYDEETRYQWRIEK